jgi:hypothetical protein
VLLKSEDFVKIAMESTNIPIGMEDYRPMVMYRTDGLTTSILITGLSALG